MLSEAGKQYERSRRIKPLEKAQRQRNYKSTSVTVNKISGNPKFSPFNTVDRQARNSYLLRVTNEPIISTNYNPKFSQTLKLVRRSTIDQAKFDRMIGDVKDEDYSIQPSSIEQKCIKSHHSSAHRPLTVRQTHNWRKTHQHFDFSKQQESKRLTFPKKLSAQQSTRADFMMNLTSITESNFNNFKRFSFKGRDHKSHLFQSYSGHQYLRQVETRQKSPQYDILATNEGFIHRSMTKTKGEKRFYLYKEKIATRKDRADKNWNTFLQYNDEMKEKVKQTINFDQTLPRRENQVHSKYPIRLSLSRPIKVKD